MGYGDARFQNAPYSYAGGSSIIPDYWADSLAKSLKTYTLWSRFATPVIVDVPLLQRGAGKKAYWSHTTDLAINDAGTLVAGSAIPYGTTSLINGDATIYEFGHSIGLEGFPMYLVDPAYRYDSTATGAKQARDAISTLNNWAVKQWDRYVGKQALTYGVQFCVRTASTYSYAVGGSTGTAALTPTTLAGLRGELMRAGKEPIPELGDLYAFVAPAGGHDWLALTGNVQRDSAALGISDAFKKGFVGAYGGFAFFEEIGANGVLGYATTQGTGVVLANDAIAASTDMGQAPDYLLFYPDVGNDSGRLKKMNVLFRGIAAQMVNSDTTAHARAIIVHYAM